MEKKVNIGDTIYAMGGKSIYEEQVAFIGTENFITELTYGERIEYSHQEYGKTWVSTFEEAKEILEKNNPDGKLVCEDDGIWNIHPNKVKLKDMTLDAFKKWKSISCGNYTGCKNCPFINVICDNSTECWVKHKDLYSDKFLEQEAGLGDEEK